MSENVEKLRKAIREERDNSGSYESEDGLATWLAAGDVTDTALVAVEQELAAKDAEIARLTAESRKESPA